jgi:hypothetical protein
MFLKHEIKAKAQNAGVRFLPSDISLVASFESDRSRAKFESQIIGKKKFMARKKKYLWKL